jgi:hypothetical protein
MAHRLVTDARASHCTVACLASARPPRQPPIHCLPTPSPRPTTPPDGPHTPARRPALRFAPQGHGGPSSGQTWTPIDPTADIRYDEDYARFYDLYSGQRKLPPPVDGRTLYTELGLLHQQQQQRQQQADLQVAVAQQAAMMGSAATPPPGHAAAALASLMAGGGALTPGGERDEGRGGRRRLTGRQRRAQLRATGSVRRAWAAVRTVRCSPAAWRAGVWFLECARAPLLKRRGSRPELTAHPAGPVAAPCRAGGDTGGGRAAGHAAGGTPADV